jgi:outer membrane protein assembly factor BamD
MRTTKSSQQIATIALLSAALLVAGCGGKSTRQQDLSASAEPDKVLYERAMEDIQKNKYDIARLTLQTLINTYPDSEYLAKAKLAIADSYYKEGTSSALTAAVAEYKDFIVFFPFLEEAAFAQMRVAMTHYRRMEKPDRDRTNARMAEEELQTFLLKYPNHPLAAEAEQRLREVQEVMAEGDYRIARYYYIKGSKRAAVARLQEIVTRYPLYSKSDESLYMLGRTYESVEQNELAANYFSKLIREYPHSERVEYAKERLGVMGYPVPQPDPEALARAEREREMGRERSGLLRRTLGMFKSGPDVSMAARAGQPNLNPPGESTSPTDVLTPGGTSTVGGTSGGTRSTVGVETVTPGAPATSNPPAKASGTPATEPKPEVKPMNKKEAEARRKQEEGLRKKEAEAKKKQEEEQKKKAEAEKKKKEEEESSSKKRKGLRKLIPW